MRFMMMVPASAAPSAETLEKMAEYNMALKKAGVLLALDGLYPPSTGTRVTFDDGKPTVTDGPFVESKEVIGGYWIIQVGSREEAIEWARRAPMSNSGVIDIRQIAEMGDFPEPMRKAVGGFA